MNRIQTAYARMEKQIEQRIADRLTTREAVAETASALDMSLVEYCKLQELKSLAVAENKLTAEEGMTIYNSMGETVETFNRQPVHVKVVLTSIFKELLSARIVA